MKRVGVGVLEGGGGQSCIIRTWGAGGIVGYCNIQIGKEFPPVLCDTKQ